MIRTLNFALLGCGRIAKRHAELLSSQSFRMRGAKLVAVCDIQESKARNFAGRYGIPGFTDFHAMMTTMGDDIDVVNVLTPSGMHASNTMEVAGYCKHVVVEKPMALRIKDGESMIKAYKQAGVRLFIVQQNRFNLPIQQLYKAVKKGRFGRIALATARVRWCRDQSYYNQDQWRGTWRWDGGAFSNQASHHIDLLNWLVGDVDAVSAYTKRQLVDIEAEDTAVAIMKFRNGALGVIEATTASRPNDLEASVSILGEHGSVVIGGFAANRIETWQFYDSRPEDEHILTCCNENPSDVYGFGHSKYLSHVVESILSGSPALVDGIEGLKSLSIIAGLYESACSGQEVRMPFIQQNSLLGRQSSIAPVDRNCVASPL